MAKRIPKRTTPRIPAQAAVDELILMPHVANVPDGVIDPFQSLSKQKRIFVSALFTCHGDMCEAARVAMGMPHMKDEEAFENSLIFRSDPNVVKAIDNSVHFLLSRRGELFIGSLWQAFAIATTSPSEETRLKAIEFLSNNVGTGLENKEVLISKGGTNGDGQGMKSLVEAIAAGMAGGVAGGVAAGAVIGERRSKMVPIDVELQEKE